MVESLADVCAGGEKCGGESGGGGDLGHGSRPLSAAEIRIYAGRSRPFGGPFIGHTGRPAVTVSVLAEKTVSARKPAGNIRVSRF